jgi:hypothetical protein
VNFGQLLQKVLPLQVEGEATGGAVGSVQDALLSGRFDDDSFVGSLVFIPATTDGNAPQGEFNEVQSYSDATGTFVLRDNFSAAVQGFDSYAIADPQYKKEPVFRVINDTLRAFGIIALADTSLTTLPQTLEYTLPLALKQFPIDRIEIGNTTDGFGEISPASWYVLPAAPGVQGKLVFNSQPKYDQDTPGNCTLRIWYRDYHEAVSVHSDPIAETIPDKRVIDECKLALFEWLMEKNSDLSEEARVRLGILQRKQAESEVKHRINNPSRRISSFLNIRDL